MQHYKNFKVYHPDKVPAMVLELPDGSPGKITWLQDEDGNDWYDVQQYFADDTMKLLYEKNGVILCHTMDVTELNPVNLSVAEVALESIPAEAVGNLTDGTWCYIDGTIQARVYTDEELQQQAQKKKAELMAQAGKIIFPLALAVKHGMATEEETSQLEVWEKYSVLLSRINPADAPEIEWPEKPE